MIFLLSVLPLSSSSTPLVMIHPLQQRSSFIHPGLSRTAGLCAKQLTVWTQPSRSVPPHSVSPPLAVARSFALPSLIFLSPLCSFVPKKLLLCPHLLFSCQKTSAASSPIMKCGVISLQDTGLRCSPACTCAISAPNLSNFWWK